MIVAFFVMIIKEFVCSSSIYFLALVFSFFLQKDNSDSFFIFFKKNKKSLLISFFVYWIPFFFLFSIKDYIFHFCLTSVMITDSIDYSVFVIIPYFLIIKKLLFLLYFGVFTTIFYNIVITIVLYFLSWIFLFLTRKFFKKDFFGLGDIDMYASLVWFYPLYNIFFSLCVGSLCGLLFIFFHKIIFLKHKLLRMIPFIPCLYIGLTFSQIPFFIDLFNYLLFL